MKKWGKSATDDDEFFFLGSDFLLLSMTFFSEIPDEVVVDAKKKDAVKGLNYDSLKNSFKKCKRLMEKLLER